MQTAAAAIMRAVVRAFTRRSTSGVCCMPPPTLHAHTPERCTRRSATRGSSPPRRFHGTWKQTFAASCCEGESKLPTHRPILVEGLYSDLLFQPWFCASTEISDTWLEHDNLPRRCASELTAEAFVARGSRPSPLHTADRASRRADVSLGCRG